jgi:hypothetical protein
MVAGPVTVHLFIMSYVTREPSVFLVEREPGVVEFPSLLLSSGEVDDEGPLVERIRASTGFTVSISGYVDPPTDTAIRPPGSRFLLARLIEGRPSLEVPHVGWEWRPAAGLHAMPFLPKLMADELWSYMD